MRFFYLKTRNQISFKKRFNKYNIFKKLKFGNIGFFFIKKFKFEYLYFFFFKKFIKFINKNKFKIINNFYFWFFLIGNYPLTKKSKNSRMGKGKGVFLRWAIILNNNFFFLEFLIYNFKFFFFFFQKKKKIFNKYLHYYNQKNFL